MEHIKKLIAIFTIFEVEIMMIVDVVACQKFDQISRISPSPYPLTLNTYFRCLGLVFEPGPKTGSLVGEWPTECHIFRTCQSRRHWEQVPLVQVIQTINNNLAFLS